MAAAECQLGRCCQPGLQWTTNCKWSPSWPVCCWLDRRPGLMSMQCDARKQCCGCTPGAVHTLACHQKTSQSLQGHGPCVWLARLPTAIRANPKEGYGCERADWLSSWAHNVANCHWPTGPLRQLDRLLSSFDLLQRPSALLRIPALQHASRRTYKFPVHSVPVHPCAFSSTICLPESSAASSV